MSRFRSAFAAPTGFVAAVTGTKTKTRPTATVTSLPAPRVAALVPVTPAHAKAA